MVFHFRYLSLYRKKTKDEVYEARKSLPIGTRNARENSGIHSNTGYGNVNILRPQLSAEVGLQRALGPNELYISPVPNVLSALRFVR